MTADPTDTDTGTAGTTGTANTAAPRVCVLAGGVGAARFLRGLLAVVPAARVSAVVNTGDDVVLHGLAVSPDLDTVTYTLSGAIDPERGWGLGGETWAFMDALRRFEAVRPPGSAAAPTWFNLGDRDLATHAYRTARLAEGATLGAVTAEIVTAFGLGLTVLPMSDDRVETRVVLAETGDEVGFQEYFVGRRHSVAVSAVRFAGIEDARPGPGVLAAIDAADVVVIAPSNPIVSIGPLLALPGVADALRARRDACVAVSPIVAGAALKGPADRMLVELGHEASVVGVARLYAPVASALVIDTADAASADAVAAAGCRPVVTDTVMRTPPIAAALARATLTAVTDRPVTDRPVTDRPATDLPTTAPGT
jgi:LPPG:FO 2-phospho-L-lactate transferase